MPEYVHDFSKVTSVGIGAFAKAHFDGAVNLSKVQTLPNAADCPEKPEGADHDYGVFEESNLEMINLSSLKSIGSRAFCACQSLGKVDGASPDNKKETNFIFPNTTSISAEAFFSSFVDPETGSYANVTMPLLKTIPDATSNGRGVFEDSKVCVIDFPELEYIGSKSFKNARSIGKNKNGDPEVYRSMNKVTYIGEEGFYLSGYGTSTFRQYVDFPEVITIGKKAFKDAGISPGKQDGNLTILDLPKCTTIDDEGLTIRTDNIGAPRYRKIYLRSIETIGEYGLAGISVDDTNYRLEIHIGPNCTNIKRMAFEKINAPAVQNPIQDQTLTTRKWDLYLYGAPTSLTIQNFDYNTTGPQWCMPEHIYVPADYVAAYKSKFNQVGPSHAGIYNDYSPFITSMELAPNPQNW